LRFIFAIRNIHGSAAPTKISTDYSGSNCSVEPICQCTHRQS
jgi:hypothetical protein